jgi:hypothetical protein
VRLQEMGAGTAIVFSDSAFFRTETLDNAIHLARTLMFELVTSETPVRMGLARGSYRMLRFLTDSSAHVSFHMSQFLGTGIVRAYQTGRCGVPGLRILLHPDLEPLLDKKALRIVPVKPSEKMRLNVQSEVNYLDTTDNHLGQDFKVGGGYLHSHIIMYDGKVINTELRYPDEFVRHKILDMIGDLYLLGFSIRGRITANMTSHGSNHALVERLYQAIQSSSR